MAASPPLTDFAEPHRDVEHRIWRNQAGQATIAIREMRTDANFAKTTGPHTHQSFLDTGDGMAFPEGRNVVYENLVVFTADPVIGDSPFFQCVIYRDFVTLIQENADIVNNCVSGLRYGTGALLIFYNLETRWEFHSGAYQ